MSLEVSIKKRFPSFTLDVAFQAGSETLGFLGASGCGKSLTLRCIAGIETPDEGRIVVNDRIFFDSERGIDLSPQERKTALLFQNYMLFPNFTVAQNVGAGIGKDVGKEERARIIEREMRRFSLSGFENRYPMQLSGGQQQRVALARMLAASPDILMLDEPFSALDSHLKGVLEQSLLSLFDSFDGTILYVSHDIDEALRFCDRIAVVESGRIMELDAGHALVDDPKSEAALKLSGCKNSVPAEKVGEHEVYLPNWGIRVHTEAIVDDDVRYFGLRAGYIEPVGEEDVGRENVYRVRVDRFSDDRFERMMLVSFIDREGRPTAPDVPSESEMSYLHRRMFWRIRRSDWKRCRGALPKVGDVMAVRIPADRIYLVAK